MHSLTLESAGIARLVFPHLALQLSPFAEADLAEDAIVNLAKMKMDSNLKAELPKEFKRNLISLKHSWAPVRSWREEATATTSIRQIKRNLTWLL